jgi:hypothetical protein
LRFKFKSNKNKTFAKFGSIIYHDLGAVSDRQTMATQLPIKLVLRNRSAVATLSDNKQDGTFLFKFIQGEDP